MASTTIPTVKGALKTKIEGLTLVTTNKAEVSYTEKPERRRDAIWLGPVENSDLQRAGFRAGRDRRNEEYELTIFVEARSAKDAQTAETLAYAYAGAIEEALADDPTLGSTAGLQWVRVNAFRSDCFDFSDGHFCQIEITAEVRSTFV